MTFSHSGKFIVYTLTFKHVTEFQHKRHHIITPILNIVRYILIVNIYYNSGSDDNYTMYVNDK